jgi:hypothetical protein
VTADNRSRTVGFLVFHVGGRTGNLLQLSNLLEARRGIKEPHWIHPVHWIIPGKGVRFTRFSHSGSTVRNCPVLGS